MRQSLVIAALAAVIGLLVGVAIQQERVRSARDSASASHARAVAAGEAMIEWQGAALELQGRLAECQRQWAVAKESAASALELAGGYRREAQEKQSEFERRWSERTSSCGAALIDMQTACADEIGDY